MSDRTSDFDRVSSVTREGIKLGYLVQGNQAHPFSLALQDLINLFVIGERAQDIYYNLLLHLCDIHQIPPIILTTHQSGGFENQICECPIWELDSTTDHITFNPLNLGSHTCPSRNVTILVNLVNQFHPLSPAARNLLHVIIWQTLVSTPTPSFPALQNQLSNYQHHGRTFDELSSLIEDLPQSNLQSNIDNVSISQLVRLPTIITGPPGRHTQLLFNMLLWKLLTDQGGALPPLFLLDSPIIEPLLFRWLCYRYLKAYGLLVVFNSKHSFPQVDSHLLENFILSKPQDEGCSFLVNELSNFEWSLLQLHEDLVAVKLRSEPVTQLVTIF